MPSLDRQGNLYFISTRSYASTLSTIHRGRFTGGPVPQSADIDIAVRDGNGFRRLPTAHGILKKVNTRALEYAPALSSDLLELFFTRLASSSGTPITGFVEAPTLSGDGRSLYYHRREDGRFVIYRVAR